MTDGWRVATAAEAGWDAVQRVFGGRGPASLCNCQRYQLVTDGPGRTVGGIASHVGHPTAANASIKARVVGTPGAHAYAIVGDA